MYNNDSDDASQKLNNSEQILQNVLLETVREQRLKRRWGIFFKLLWLSLIALAIWGVFLNDSTHTKPHDSKKHIAQVRVEDEIGAQATANADDIIEALDDAADDPQTQAIVMTINSPGGSPVQASYIYNELQHLHKAHPTLPIYSVCEDICTSAAYYIASGTDKIYANPTSLVGSIGVVMDEFGFVDAMKKIGISRRIFTSGEHKGFLDPFSPLKPDEVKIIQGMLDDVHRIFIEDVKKGRGNRLKDSPEIFSGLVWDGHQALPLGLIDGFGSIQDVARDQFKNTEVVDYSIKRNMFEQFVTSITGKFAHQFKNEFLGMHYGD
jgi:protease IV